MEFEQSEQSNRPLKIIALTPEGQALAEVMQKKMLDAGLMSDVLIKPKPFTEKVQAMFNAGDRLVFICSTGIVFRTLAPVLTDKHRDPPVLVLDEAGQFVVPLLSGHEGGANELASQIAKLLNANLVLTSAKRYLQPVYTVGMGCERDCPIDQLQSLLTVCLKQSGLSLNQIMSINSIDIKADETGLIELARSCKKPYQTFNKQQLSSVTHLLSVKSDYVFKTVGVYGVAEAAALVAANASVSIGGEVAGGQRADSDQAELHLNKQKNAYATCAIARIYRDELNV